MSDTIRTLASLQTLLADNSSAAISPQDLRDFLVSVDPENVIGAGLASGRPSNTIAGILYFSSDDPTLSRDTGSVWQSYGPIFKFTPPVVANYSWVNQGSATVTQQGNTAVLIVPATSGVNLRCQVKSAPSTPYNITIAYSFSQGSGTFVNMGACWRQSSDGKLITCMNDANLTKTVTKWSSPTLVSANYGSVTNIRSSIDLVWFRISDDGTNRKCFVSNDGLNFLQIHTIGRTDFMTADQVGFYIDAENSISSQMTLYSWAET